MLLTASRQCILKLLSFEETPDAAPWVLAYIKFSFSFCLTFLILLVICLLLACSSQMNITGVVRKMGQFDKCISLQSASRVNLLIIVQGISTFDPVLILYWPISEQRISPYQNFFCCNIGSYINKILPYIHT